MKLKHTILTKVIYRFMTSQNCIFDYFTCLCSLNYFDCFVFIETSQSLGGGHIVQKSKHRTRDTLRLKHFWC